MSPEFWPLITIAMFGLGWFTGEAWGRHKERSNRKPTMLYSVPCQECFMLGPHKLDCSRRDARTRWQ